MKKKRSYTFLKIRKKTTIPDQVDFKKDHKEFIKVKNMFTEILHSIVK